MAKKLTIIILFCLLILDSITLNAQRRRSDRRATETEQQEERPAEKQDGGVLQIEKAEDKPELQADPTRVLQPLRTPLSREALEVIENENINIIEISEPVVSEKPNGKINWTEQYIEAIGASVIDTERFKNIAQAKAMATRGAVVVAQRNLLEIINGVQVTSETVVVDMVVKSDVIHTRVDGIIKGAEIVGEPVENMGMIEVRMRVSLYGRNGLATAIFDELPEHSAYAKTSEAVIDETKTDQELSQELKEQLLGSLVFDYKGQKIDPAMFPVILDENNNLLLDLSKIYDPNKGNFPVYLDASRDLLESLGVKDGLKIIDVLSSEPGVIKVDTEKARGINWSRIGEVAGAIGKFLMLFI